MAEFFEFLWVFFAGLKVVLPVHSALFFTIAINGLVIGRIEGWRASESLYHAFINATTVGYGDYSPTRPLTRCSSWSTRPLRLRKHRPVPLRYRRCCRQYRR